MWANPTGCKADTRRSGRCSLGPGKDTSQSAHSRVKAFSFWEGLHKNVAPLKTDKRRATRMVSEQEIWAKTGWTGAEILERAGAERLWVLSPGAYLNHHTWRKSITVPTSFIAMTKPRVWQATRKVGVRQWEHDLGQPWNKKNSSVTATEIRTPQSSSLSEKPAFSQDSSTSEVSPQLLPARSSLHKQRSLHCQGRAASAPGGSCSSWDIPESNRGRSGGQNLGESTWIPFLGMLREEAWLRPVTSRKIQ